MNFKGKYEQIVETTLGRYQQGGIMGGDIVKIKPNALNHPKVKDMAENIKGKIKMLMDTDLNITVIGVRSTRDSRGEMSDGLGISSTTSPTDFWLDVAVLHSPGLRGDPLTIPIEIAERVDFGGNMPSVPDSLKRKGNINIKPIEVGPYNNMRGDTYQNPTKNTKLAFESLEDAYDDVDMGTDASMDMGPGEPEPENVTVRVPLEDTDEVKDVFDQCGVTYSVIGTNRYEIHGTMDDIQKALNMASDANEDEIEVEFVGAEGPKADPTQQIPNLTGTPDNAEPKIDKPDDDDNLEEAYANIMNGVTTTSVYTVEIPNAFADNVKTYLAQEGVSSMAVVDGNKTYIDIVTTSDKDQILEALKDNVMGDLTYLKVYRSDQRLAESR